MARVLSNIKLFTSTGPSYGHACRENLLALNLEILLCLNHNSDSSFEHVTCLSFSLLAQRKGPKESAPRTLRSERPPRLTAPHATHALAVALRRAVRGRPRATSLGFNSCFGFGLLRPNTNSVCSANRKTSAGQSQKEPLSTHKPARLFTLPPRSLLHHHFKPHSYIKSIHIRTIIMVVIHIIEYHVGARVPFPVPLAGTVGARVEQLELATLTDLLAITGAVRICTH